MGRIKKSRNSGYARFVGNAARVLMPVIAILAVFCLRACGSDKNAEGPTSPGSLKTIRIASGLSRPVFVCAPPGDHERIFILEQYTGSIKIWSHGSISSAPFLDVHSLITTRGNEQGLLGMAFHPNYGANGYFFVNYTNTSGNTVVERFHVSPDPNIADPASGQIVITIPQPYENHNGGMIAFGPNDGYLYIGMGDGGSEGDPQNRGQDGRTLLGKMLRIDVDGHFPYAVPPNNPFVDSTSTLPEIWAKGVRNPWRYSFDSQTGDLYIADVGQDEWEEIDFQPAADKGGENYGWRLMEGNHCYNPAANCDPDHKLTYPIHEYHHDDGLCSITGGYVYRGSAIPSLRGTYFFGDYCSGQIWSFKYDGKSMSQFTERTKELAPEGGLAIRHPSSFGEDGYGELYIVDHLDGQVFKIVPR